jgi:hypothetical protein
VSVTVEQLTKTRSLYAAEIMAANLELDDAKAAVTRLDARLNQLRGALGAIEALRKREMESEPPAPPAEQKPETPKAATKAK